MVFNSLLLIASLNEEDNNQFINIHPSEVILQVFFRNLSNYLYKLNMQLLK